MSKPIYDITPFTLLDFPDKTACIIWYAGCNMRCGYCYNPDIVLGKGKISIEEVMHFLKRREGLLDGVVMSGGECTMHPSLADLAIAVKNLGMKVKIDTNGSRPNVLQKLHTNDTLDYVALDFKAVPEKFQTITQSELFAPFEESLAFLIQNKIPFEVRTTVHSQQLSPSDISKMRDYLTKNGYEGTYYLQHYVNDVKTLGRLTPSEKHIFQQDFSNEDLKVELRSSL